MYLSCSRFGCYFVPRSDHVCFKRVLQSAVRQRLEQREKDGRFQTRLPAGSWHVYLFGADDLAVYNSRIDVNEAQSRQVTLVSRSN